MTSPPPMSPSSARPACIASTRGKTIRSILLAGALISGSGCHDNSPSASAPDSADDQTDSASVAPAYEFHSELTRVAAEDEQEFAIHWPPRDPASHRYQSATPLLTGTLRIIAGTETEASGPLLALQVLLKRPENEASREFWNRQLEFPEYDWMSRVRAWDSREEWLWPNLPFLLRAHGEERVERYGGIDPGRGVDNDYAAVLIRACRPNGEELPVTRDQPLVSAEWFPVPLRETSRSTIVHDARSQTFRLALSQLTSPEAANSGQLQVWLIYADFLETSVSSRWPREPEHAGGILAWFSVDWENNNDHIRLAVSHSAPESATGFDWENWIEEQQATAHLSIPTDSTGP